MGKRDTKQKNVAEGQTTEENATPATVQEQEEDANANPSNHTNLTMVLRELRDFRKETNQQLSDIRLEINITSMKISEVETRIGKTEDRVQNIEHVLSKRIKV